MKMSREAFMERSRKAGAFDAKALAFQDKMVMKGGLGDHTYLPDAMHASPPVPSMALAREEAEIVMFAAVRDALAAANLRPADVDCVVVNCSLFNPTPSLAAMLVNHFKMRSDVVSYSLSGMGCSAGVISIALARELLQTYKNSTCLVVSTVSRLFFSHFFLRSFLFFLSLALSFSRSLFHLTLSVSLSLFPENQKKKPKKKKKNFDRRTSPRTGTLATSVRCLSPTASSASAAPRSCCRTSPRTRAGPSTGWCVVVFGGKLREEK